MLHFCFWQKEGTQMCYRTDLTGGTTDKRKQNCQSQIQMSMYTAVKRISQIEQSANLHSKFLNSHASSKSDLFTNFEIQLFHSLSDECELEVSDYLICT